MKLDDLSVKLFTDGADKAQILDMAAKPWIKGFTTNPSLLKKAGVADYAAYGRELVAALPDRHISFEVFSDDIPEMVAQAQVIAAWGSNVYVKLPVTNTRGEALYEAVRALSRDGVKINMTAIFTPTQVARAVESLAGGAPACVSVFAGRLADLGIDYRPIMADAVELRTLDCQRRDHLGVDPRSIQRCRGRRHPLPHHYGACRCAQEAAGTGHEDGRRTVAGCRARLPRGCRRGRVDASDSAARARRRVASRTCK
jgi:transaldolase